MNTSELESRCGTLIIGGFEGLAAPAELLERIARGYLGGVILFKRNIEDLAQVRELCRELRAAQAPDTPPLLIAIDQEGGRVQRVGAPLPAWPPMKLLGVVDDVELTRRVGQAIGRDLRALGFDLDFAPVLDVVDNSENTVIGDRSFGGDPELVARHGVALAEGLGDVGILACGKHFPGHGGPVADSHEHLPRDCRSQAELERSDLRPFVGAITAQVPLLMVAHVAYPGIVGEEVPATFSEVLCTKLLRDVLGFTGVLCSDDLEMGAIADCCSVPDAGIRAVRAGIDLLLVCHLRERQEALRRTLAETLRMDEALRSSVALALTRVERLHQGRRVALGSGPLPPATASLTCFEELRARVASAS